MANRSSTGFRPAFRLGGGEIPVMRYLVSASRSTSTAIYIGDVVSHEDYGGVEPSAADAGVGVTGVVIGCYDSNGTPAGAPGSTLSTKYIPASTAGYVDVALALPDAVFAVQCATALTAVAINATSDHVAGTGSTVTGYSGHYLNGASLNTAAQCRILGLVDEPNNAWGANQDVYVVFHESCWGIVDTAVGV